MFGRSHKLKGFGNPKNTGEVEKDTHASLLELGIVGSKSSREPQRPIHSSAGLAYDYDAPSFPEKSESCLVTPDAALGNQLCA